MWRSIYLGVFVSRVVSGDTVPYLRCCNWFEVALRILELVNLTLGFFSELLAQECKLVHRLVWY